MPSLKGLFIDYAIRRKSIEKQRKRAVKQLYCLWLGLDKDINMQ